MNLLISTPQNNFFSVAIGDKAVVDFRIIKRKYSQSELLLKNIEDILKQKNIKTSKQRKINAIFVVEGPGAFSALRVGIATANALAYSLNAPVFGVRIEKEWENLTPEEQMEKIWDKGLTQQNNKTFKQPAVAGATVGRSVNQLTSRPVNRFIRPFYGQEPHITRKNEKTEKQKN